MHSDTSIHNNRCKEFVYVGIWAYMFLCIYNHIETLWQKPSQTIKVPNGLACARFHGESMTTCGKFPVLTTQVKISNQSKDFEKPVVVFGSKIMKTHPPQAIPNCQTNFSHHKCSQVNTKVIPSGGPKSCCEVTCPVWLWKKNRILEWKQISSEASSLIWQYFLHKQKSVGFWQKFAKKREDVKYWCQISSSFKRPLEGKKNENLEILKSRNVKQVDQPLQRSRWSHPWHRTCLGTSQLSKKKTVWLPSCRVPPAGKRTKVKCGSYLSSGGFFIKERIYHKETECWDKSLTISRGSSYLSKKLQVQICNYMVFPPIWSEAITVGDHP